MEEGQFDRIPAHCTHRFTTAFMVDLKSPSACVKCAALGNHWVVDITVVLYLGAGKIAPDRHRTIENLDRKPGSETWISREN